MFRVVEDNRPELVKLLLDKGSNPNVRLVSISCEAVHVCASNPFALAISCACNLSQPVRLSLHLRLPVGAHW